MYKKAITVFVLTLFLVSTISMNPGANGLASKNISVEGVKNEVAPTLVIDNKQTRYKTPAVDYLQLPNTYNSTLINMNIGTLVVRGDSHIYIESSTITDLYIFDTSQVYIKGGSISHIYMYDYSRLYIDGATVTNLNSEPNLNIPKANVQNVYISLNNTILSYLYVNAIQATVKISQSTITSAIIQSGTELYISDSNINYLRTGIKGTVERSQIGEFDNWIIYIFSTRTIILPGVINFYNTTINNYYGVIQYDGPGEFSNGTMISGSIVYYGTNMDNYTKSNIGKTYTTYLLFTGHWNIVNTTFGNTTTPLNSVYFINSSGYLKDVDFVTGQSYPSTNFVVFIDSEYTVNGYLNATKSSGILNILFESGNYTLDRFYTPGGIFLRIANLTIKNSHLMSYISMYGRILNVYDSEVWGLYGYYIDSISEIHFKNVSLNFAYLQYMNMSQLSSLENVTINSLYISLSIANQHGIIMDKQFVINLFGSTVSLFKNVSIGSVYLNLEASDISATILSDFYLTGLTMYNSNVTLVGMYISTLNRDYRVYNSTLVFRSVSTPYLYSHKMYFYNSNVSIIDSTITINYVIGLNFYNSNLIINSSKLGSTNVISSTLTVLNSTIMYLHIIDSIAEVNDTTIYSTTFDSSYYALFIIDRSHAELNNVNITGITMIWYSTSDAYIERTIPSDMIPTYTKVNLNSVGVVFNKVNITAGYYVEGLVAYGVSTLNATSATGGLHNTTLSATSFSYPSKQYAIFGVGGGNLTITGPLSYNVWGISTYFDSIVKVKNIGVMIKKVGVYDSSILEISTSSIYELVVQDNSTFIGSDIKFVLGAPSISVGGHSVFILKGTSSTIHSLYAYDYATVEVVNTTLYYGISVMDYVTLNVSHSSFNTSSPYPKISMTYFYGKALIEYMNFSTPFPLYYMVSTVNLGYGSGSLTIVNSNITTLYSRAVGKLTVINSTIDKMNINIEKDILASWNSLTMPKDQEYHNATWLSNNKIVLENTNITTLNNDYYYFTSNGYMNNTAIVDNNTTAPRGIICNNTNITNITGGPIIVATLNTQLFANSTTASYMLLVQSPIPKPSVKSLTANLTFEKGLSRVVEWEASTPAPQAYTVLANGTIMENKNMRERNTIITYDLSSLEPGFYSITLRIIDGYGQTAEASVFVRILKASPPVIVSKPNDMTVPIGETVNLTWVIEDSSPATYEIYINDSVVSSGNWSNAVPINYHFTSTTAGIFEIKFVATDQVGQSTVAMTYITVYKPKVEITSSITRNITEEGYPTYIYWQITSTSNGTYNILSNGTIISTGSFSNGDTIVLNLTSMKAGYYNFTIKATTQDGAIGTDSVFVEITPREPPTVIYLNNKDFYNISTNETITLSWKAQDTLPDTYTIYINGTVNKTGTWENGQIISITFSGSEGVYNITIVFEDKLGQKTTHSVTVNVYKQEAGTGGEEGTGGEGQGEGTTPAPTTDWALIFAGVTIFLIAAVILFLLYRRGYIPIKGS